MRSFVRLLFFGIGLVLMLVAIFVTAVLRVQVTDPAAAAKILADARYSTDQQQLLVNSPDNGYALLAPLFTYEPPAALQPYTAMTHYTGDTVAASRQALLQDPHATAADAARLLTVMPTFRQALEKPYRPCYQSLEQPEARGLNPTNDIQRLGRSMSYYAYLLIPDARRAMALYKRCCTRAAAAVIMAALEQHKLQSGTYPPTLETLSLRPLPRDLMSRDNRFHYQPKGNDYVLESISPLYKTQLKHTSETYSLHPFVDDK